MGAPLGSHHRPALRSPDHTRSHLPTTCCSFCFLYLRESATLHPTSRPETCASCQMLQRFLSSHHSVYVASLPESTHLLSAAPSPLPLALLSSRLSSPLSFIGHRHTPSPPSLLPEHQVRNASLVLLYPWSDFCNGSLSMTGGKYLNKTHMY